ncbi:hypothetical protein DTO027B5_1892 [Paecilomyces variotii]|nr:hypothetical protein DTO169C6_1012 [Paecilomyces variotii]KAJ9231902.1 hypothetical protein DTO169E5_7725 [Paecilomyces variotii]KAJ9253617.1 hypothetical protein DTO207G8_4041 [Paecilomyces variotii]KAJ9327504.1 hypothetical protein DTO027B3_1726 [Paecilomyces variotii]KAJ9336211.1 hypothetical protein DTO027B5_1892 [Paecilomyces variotii]
MSTSDRSLHFSDSFGVSCGTVTLDPIRRKVLLIRWKKTGEFFLPKGRKNIGETLEDAALRETYEETGFRVALFPLPIPTLATPATVEDTLDGSSVVTEPVAVSQRVRDGKLKIIFWFAARGDATATADAGTQQEWEDFESIWADYELAGPTLTFDDDRSIVRAVLDMVCETSSG